MASVFGIKGRATAQKLLVTVVIVTHIPAESVPAISIIKTARFILDPPHFIRCFDVALHRPKAFTLPPEAFVRLVFAPVEELPDSPEYLGP